MRFAALVTVLIALAATPVVAKAGAPAMDETDFLAAVQCTAYDNLAQFAAEAPYAARNRALLDIEARAQRTRTAQEARRLADEVAREGEGADDAEDIAALRAARAAACRQEQMADASLTMVSG